MLKASPLLRQLASELQPALGLADADSPPHSRLELAKFATNRHRVGALLHRSWTLRGDGVGEALSFLEKVAARNARNELRQKAATRRLAELLQAQDIGWIEFKGWRLGEELYGESALRQSKDVDLLVEPGRLRDAVDLVAEHGYLVGGRTGQSAKRRARRVLRHHREIDIVDPALRVQVELHSRLLGYPPEGWRDPVVGGNQSESAVSLENPDYVLYLIVHGALTGWKRLKWLCDLVMLARKISPQVRFAVTERACAIGCEAALVASLLVVAELWDAEVVAPWLAETRTSRDDALVQGHLATISRRLGLADQPPFAERALRHAGILRDAPVFGKHPAPMRGLRDRAALWLLAKV